MADDFGDKTEAPTPRKREEAREQGKVAKSTDLTASVSLVFAVVMLGWWGPGLMSAMRDVMAEALATSTISDLRTGTGATLALRGLSIAALALAPLVVGLMMIAALGNVLQVGIRITPERLAPNLNAFNPVKGLKNIFSGWSTFAQLGMNLLKLVILSAVAYSAVNGRLAEIVAIQQLGHMQAFGLVAGLVYDVALRLAVVLLILAVIDYGWRKFKFEQELKMTKQEVKDEMKSHDGDPMLKQRRRQIALKMLREKQKKAVPTADVVITNPTEYAIALKYDPATGNAPRVVAKGRGLIAAEIRRIAVSNGVPILERPPLARALYRLVEVGQEIPEEFYSTVAEILAYVYELTGKLRARRAGAA